MGKRHGDGSAHQRAVAAAKRATEREVVPDEAAPPVVSPAPRLFSNPPKSPQSSRDWLRELEEFLKHPLVWGVVALIALAIALSGKLSVSLATVIMWVAWATATFGLYRFAVRSFTLRPVLGFLVLAVVGGVLVWPVAVANHWLSTKPETGKPEIPVPPPDPRYPPPSGPLVRMEGKAEAASETMCQGMSAEQRITCLCPDSLPYSLKALPSPKENNYSTELDIKKSERPFYRIRAFARTPISVRYGWTLDPPLAGHSASASLGIFDYDPYSFVLTSTQGENEMKIEVHSAEGLRLYCVNQEN
jgi:hypothetical protein